MLMLAVIIVLLILLVTLAWSSARSYFVSGKCMVAGGNAHLIFCCVLTPIRITATRVQCDVWLPSNCG